MTDLSQPMLDHAASVGTSRPVTWKQADAMALPFADASFDVVVCQFGVMFLPDRAQGYAELRRVLRDGGVLLFTVWDRIEENEFADVVTGAVATMFPDDPPMFLARTPHGYHDTAIIGRDLLDGGFAGRATFDVLEARSRAPSCRVPAIGYCEGTPLRMEIEARRPGGVAEATEVAAAAIGERFGRADVDGKIRGLVVTVENS